MSDSSFCDNTASDLASLPGYFVSDFRLNVDCAKLIGQEVSLIFSLNNWLDKLLPMAGSTGTFPQGMMPVLTIRIHAWKGVMCTSRQAFFRRRGGIGWRRCG